MDNNSTIIEEIPKTRRDEVPSSVQLSFFKLYETTSWIYCIGCNSCATSLIQGCDITSCKTWDPIVFASPKLISGRLWLRRFRSCHNKCNFAVVWTLLERSHLHLCSGNTRPDFSLTTASIVCHSSQQLEKGNRVLPPKILTVPK